MMLNRRVLSCVGCMGLIASAGMTGAWNPPASTNAKEPKATYATGSGSAGRTNDESGSVSADQALARLMEGNARYVANIAEYPNTGRLRREEVAAGQHPFVTVLSCADSRVPVEYIFDQGIGDTFVIRVAGNVCGTNEAGTIEYGVEHLKTPLLVVMGHSACGAVTAAATNAEVSGNVAALVSHIKPAVAEASHNHPEMSGKDLVPTAIESNVFQSIAELIAESAPVREAVERKDLKIVGCVYDIETGYVRWLGKHPEQDGLIAAANAGGTEALAGAAEEKEGADAVQVEAAAKASHGSEH